MSALDQPTGVAADDLQGDAATSLDQLNRTSRYAADLDVDDWNPVGTAASELDAEDPERERTASVSLFEGDEGGLEVDQRRALVVLVKQRFISGRTHPKEWRALTRNPRPIRARLNDLFLDLHLDLEREVAFKRQVTPEGGGRPFPTLLYDAPWGREDTILLVYLRSRLRSEQAAGADRVFVDREDMLEFVEQHRPAHATDHAGDARRANAAIAALYSAGLLFGRSDADRFEVSNALEVLLPMDKLQQLLAWLRTQNGTVPAGTANETHDDATDGYAGGGAAHDENES